MIADKNTIAKNCTKCGMQKFLKDFHQQGHKVTGQPRYTSHCAACRSTKGKKKAFKRPTKPAAPAPASFVSPPSAVLNRPKQNHFVFVLDDSVSMGHLEGKVRSMVNDQIANIARNAELHGQEALVTVRTFFHGTPRLRVPASACRPLTGGEYAATGHNTPLYKNVYGALMGVSSFDEANENMAHVLFAFTDGEDNASFDWSFNRNHLVETILKKLATDRWTITFMVPQGARRLIDVIGIQSGNIQEWEQTTKGVEKVADAYALGTQSYFNSRSLGQTKTNAFFTTDLSKLGAKQLSQLTDLHSILRVLEVKSENNIKEFVESKNKGSYVIGSAFYQLMKAEKVQAHKAILVRDKATGAIYGGAEARKLINLPDYEVKVVPGNHAGFDLFIQSTSPNRILPRGTQVILNTTHLAPSQPTWIAPPPKA